MDLQRSFASLWKCIYYLLILPAWKSWGLQLFLLNSLENLYSKEYWVTINRPVLIQSAPAVIILSLCLNDYKKYLHNPGTAHAVPAKTLSPRAGSEIWAQLLVVRETSESIRTRVQAARDRRPTRFENSDRCVSSTTSWSSRMIAEMAEALQYRAKLIIG